MNDLGNKKIMGENIKRRMARLGVSRKEIASALQVPYSTVCEWISGNAYPRIDKIQLLAQYFGITKAQLVEAPGQVSLPDDPPVRDVAQKLSETLAMLEEAGDGLMFDGEPLDEETRQLLRASLENQLEMTKRLAKQKFTPKKYRKE